MILRELVTLLTFKADTRGAREADGALDKVRQNAEKTANILRGAFAVVAGALAGSVIVKAADDATSAMNRVNSTLKGTGEDAAAAMERITQGALSTGIAVTETTSAFMRFAPALRVAGKSTEDTINLIEGLQKGMLAAGASSAEVGGILVQLGQAINSGNFAGDELKAFMEAAPPKLLQDFANALGTSVDKIKEMGAEGKLTNKQVLPALQAAAANAGKEFNEMTVTMALAQARISVAFTALVGDLDKIFRGSERVVFGMTKIRDAMEWVRARLGVIREFGEEMGGLDRVLKAVGVTLLIMFSPAIIAGVWALITALAPLIATFLAILAVVFLVSDALDWFAGRDSIFNDMFGPFDQAVGEPVMRFLSSLKADFLRTWEEVKAGWANVSSFFRDIWAVVVADFATAQGEFARYVALFNSTVDAIKAVWATVSEFFKSIWGTVVSDFSTATGEFTRYVRAFNAMVDAIKSVWNGIPDFFSNIWANVKSSFEGALRGLQPTIDALKAAGNFVRNPFGLGSTPAAPAPNTAPTPTPQGERHGSLTQPFATLAGLNMDAATRGSGASAGPSMGDVTINQQVDVTATGSSGAEVADGARRGTQLANGDAMRAWEGLTSRRLGMSSPSTEARVG